MANPLDYYSLPMSVPPVGPPSPAASYYTPASPPPPPPAGAEGLPPELRAQLDSKVGAPPPAPPPGGPEWTGEKPYWVGLPGQKPPPAVVAAEQQRQATAQQAQNQADSLAAVRSGAATTLAPITITKGMKDEAPGAPPPPRAAGGGAGGVSPFGKLQGASAAAQRAVLGTYDVEKEAKGAEGREEAARAAELAAKRSDMFRLQQEDAAIAHQEEREASDRFEAHMAETQRQLDDVKSRKIDPNRYMSESGAGIFSVLGGIVGGLYQGLNHMKSNPFIDDLNKAIDRDIDAQKTDISNEKDAVQGRMSLLSQMRAAYHDHALADLQARNVVYESAKQQLEAEAARYDAPIIQARTQDAVNAIDRQQKQIQQQIADRALLTAQQQAAAAAAAARAARKEAFDNSLKLIELGQKDREIDAKALAERTKAGDKTEGQLATLGKELSEPKLVEARGVIDDLKRKLTNPATGQIDGSRGIPGVGPGADLREKIAPPIGEGGALDVVGALGPAGTAARAGSRWALGLSDEERVGRENWNRLFDAYKVAVTGAGASEGEIANLRKSFSGATTPAEQANAIRQADKALAEREARLKAGVNPSVARTFDQRVKQERAAAQQPVVREEVGSDERMKDKVRSYWGK